MFRLGCLCLDRLGFAECGLAFSDDSCESTTAQRASSDMSFFAVVGIYKTKTLTNKDAWVIESENVILADPLGNFSGPFCHGAVWNEPSEVYSHCLSFAGFFEVRLEIHSTTKGLGKQIIGYMIWGDWLSLDFLRGIFLSRKESVDITAAKVRI